MKGPALATYYIEHGHLPPHCECAQRFHGSSKPSRAASQKDGDDAEGADDADVAEVMAMLANNTEAAPETREADAWRATRRLHIDGVRLALEAAQGINRYAPNAPRRPAE